MFKRILILLPLWIWVGMSTMLAQTFPIRHYTVEDGMPSDNVYEVYADKFGYLWAGTNKGLARYNGLDFKIFTTSDGLPSNEIFGINEDGEGRLWLVTFSGELCYYESGVFHTPANTPWLRLPLRSTTRIVKVEKDGSLTHVLENATILNIHHKKVTLISLEHLVSSASEILIATKISPSQYRLIKGDRYIDINTKGAIQQETKFADGNPFLAAINTKDVDLYGKKGIYNLDGHLIQPINQFKFDKFSTLRIFQRPGSPLLIGKYNGLFLNDSFKLLQNIYITQIAQDRSGNYWIATRDNGLYKLSKNLFSIQEYKHAYKDVISAKASGNGLVFVDQAQDFFQLRQNKFSFLQKATKEQTSLIQGNFLIQDHLNYFQVHAKDKTLTCDVTIGGIKRHMQTAWPNSSYIKKIFISDQDLFIVSISFVYKLALKDILRNHLDLKTIVHARNEFSNRIYSRALDESSGHLWINRLDGMYKIVDTQLVAKKNFKGIVFLQFEFYEQYLLGFTDKNKLLICNKFDGDAIIDSVSEKDCIWNNIYRLDDHHAIIGTNKNYRLITLQPPAPDGKPRYTIQTIEDPFIPQQAEYIAADSNNCYFFKNGSITKVATSVLFQKTSAPAPIFSSFKTQNKAYLIKPEIRISYDQSRSINITFDNVSFVSKNITCQYSITDNGKDEWREITGNEINLNTPGYGTYLIKIRSKTLSSEYSKPAVIKLIVQKPFWATWWFISLCALALIMLVWGIIVFITWRKLRKKQKEHDADMKYQQSEYKALNALMNPHFIFNSLNNIQGLINKDEKRIANEYLVIFSDLVRQNMHNISKGFITLQQELTLIENYLTLEKLRFKELVNYEIKVGEEVDVDDIMIPPLMIQPLVENAVKHGLLPKQSPLSKVMIQVYEKENTVYIEIEDNGIGLTQSLKSQNKLHESFGLSNLQKRTEHLKKIQQHEISIEVKELIEADGTVKGTKAVVILNLKEAS